MKARASCTSGAERPSLHAQGPEPRFPCRTPLAPRCWTPRSATTTGDRAGRRCHGAPELHPPPKSGLLPFVSNTDAREGTGAPGVRGRRGYGRLGVRPRLWTKRGGRGDLVGLLTGVRDEGEEAGFRRRAELGRTTTAATDSVTSRGSAPGRLVMRSERCPARKARLWTLGMKARRSAPDVHEARAFMEIDSNSTCREREGKGD
jgi:hypothetical protein